MDLATNRSVRSRRLRCLDPLLAGGAPLPASGLQHLLMLLLAHPLAAFFDKRAHDWPQVSGFATLHVKINASHLGPTRWSEKGLTA